MRYDKESHITGVLDVDKFFEHLVFERGLNFHPDDPFEGYLYENDEPMFSADEAKLYNRLMNEAFCVCEQNDVSIYDIGVRKLLKTFKTKQAEMYLANMDA